MDRHFQVSPEMFDWVQVQALAGPLTELFISYSIVLAVLRNRNIVLLEGKSSAQSEVLNTLD